MEKKKCSSCNRSKTILYYDQDKNKKYFDECKLCRINTETFPCYTCENFIEGHLMHYDRGKVSTKCQQCHRLQSKSYYTKNKEYKKALVKEYTHSNKEKVQKYQETYRTKNKKKTKVYNKSYRICNKEKIKNYIVSYNKRNYVKIRKNLHNRLLKLLKSENKSRTIDYLGCDLNMLLLWLEYQFDSEMSWDNYGKYWHIDHCLPCKSFNLLEVNERRKCFNWKNLQPMEAIQNIQKGDKIDSIIIMKQEIKVKSFICQHKRLFTLE